MKLYLLDHTFKYDMENILRIFIEEKIYTVEHATPNTSAMVPLEIEPEGAHYETWLSKVTAETATLEDPSAWAAVSCVENIRGQVYGCAFVTHKEHTLLKRVAVSEWEGDRNALKNALKCALYDAFSEITGERSPWGILVGVRPVKLFHEMMDAGMPVETIQSILQKRYRIREDKVQLMANVGGVERAAIFPVDPASLALYVAVPFCKSRCYYCSFPGYLSDRFSGLMAPYEAAVRKEITAVMDHVNQKVGRKTDLLYIGGGTPTAISATHIKGIVDTLKNSVNLNDIKEFTIEAGRPDTLDDAKIKVLTESGADRICLNPQTMLDETLKRIGRLHTATDIEALYKTLKQSGFKSINMDLIAGLDGESLKDFQYTLEAVCGLRPENITVHTLSVKRASKLNEFKADYALTEERLIEQMVELAASHLGQEGYLPYYMYRQKNIMANLENVGYTLPGFESPYNMKIMEERNTFLGFGPGAASKIFCGDNRFERHNNIRSVETYIDRIDDMIEQKIKLFDQM